MSGGVSGYIMEIGVVDPEGGFVMAGVGAGWGEGVGSDVGAGMVVGWGFGDGDGFGVAVGACVGVGVNVTEGVGVGREGLGEGLGWRPPLLLKRNVLPTVAETKSIPNKRTNARIRRDG